MTRCHILPVPTADQVGTPPGDEPAALKLLRARQALISEFLVRRMLKDEKTLKRYWHVHAWYGGRFIGGSESHRIHFPLTAQNTRDGLLQGNPEQFWFWARNFVLLAHGTGRDDLLKNSSPDDLKTRCSVWYDWLKENGARLRADREYPRWVFDQKLADEGLIFDQDHVLPPLRGAARPFPDWAQVPPPPFKLLEDSVYIPDDFRKRSKQDQK